MRFEEPRQHPQIVRPGYGFVLLSISDLTISSTSSRVRPGSGLGISAIADWTISSTSSRVNPAPVPVFSRSRAERFPRFHRGSGSAWEQSSLVTRTAQSLPLPGGSGRHRFGANWRSSHLRFRPPLRERAENVRIWKAGNFRTSNLLNDFPRKALVSTIAGHQ